MSYPAFAHTSKRAHPDIDAHRAQITYSAHDVLALGFLGYLLDTQNSDESTSLATIVRTNPVAINFFRSLFNMDPMDALEDCLTRKRGQYTDIVTLMASLEDSVCNASNRSSVFEAINYSTLGYAIKFSPGSVESLLASGEDAAAVHDANYTNV